MLYVWATDKAAGTIVDSLFLLSVVVLFVFSLKERKKMSRTKLSLSLFFFVVSFLMHNYYPNGSQQKIFNSTEVNRVGVRRNGLSYNCNAFHCLILSKYCSKVEPIDQIATMKGSRIGPIGDVIAHQRQQQQQTRQHQIGMLAIPCFLGLFVCEKSRIHTDIPSHIHSFRSSTKDTLRSDSGNDFVSV